MTITIKKHPEYDLRRPKFLCDHILKDDAPTPFDMLVNGYKFICIVGGSGMGKTSLLVSCLLDKRILKKTYENVIAVIPETSRKSMKKDPFVDLHPEKLFDSLDDIENIFQLVSSYSSQGESSLIVIDDQQSYLKQYDISNILNHIIANRRHLKTTIIVLLQTYNLLSLKTRKLINTLITFRPTKKEWKSISEECLEYDDDTNNQIFKLAFPHDQNYKWLLIDLQTQRVFANFNELIVDD